MKGMILLKFENISKTYEDYIIITYGCIRIVYSYQFLPCSLGSLPKTFNDNNHFTLENLKKEIVGDELISNIVSGIERLISEDKTTEHLKKIFFPDETEK